MEISMKIKISYRHYPDSPAATMISGIGRGFYKITLILGAISLIVGVLGFLTKSNDASSSLYLVTGGIICLAAAILIRFCSDKLAEHVSRKK